jgi:uncharacterized membrane protein
MDPIVDLGWLGPVIVASVVGPIVLTLIVLGVVVWAIRRNAPRREEPAVEELKARLARGEIDPIEYQVRLRSLQGPPD